MNNYRNYGNYGNRRYAGNTDECNCAGNNAARMMQNRMNMKQEKDCGCGKNEVMAETNCGCGKNEVMAETNCGCTMADEKKEQNCGYHEKKEDKCDCAIESMYREVERNGACCEEDMPGKALAMAYVPWQTWRKLYEVCEGFSTGTIFKELDLEFLGRRCN